MIIFLLFPCKTTCACVTNSSGTKGAGTATNERPDDPPPIITPVLLELEP